MGVIDMGRQFYISARGWDILLGMAVTLADRHHSGNDPRRISPRKIMLRFGAIISATIFKSRGNTPKGSTTICDKIQKQTQKYMSSEGQRIAPRLMET